MPRYAGGAEAVVPAAIDDVWAALLDYEAIPRWQSAVRRADVRARDERGRGVEVAYEIDVKLGVVRYTLRHHYEEPTRIASTYVEGDFRDCDGAWSFADRGDGTTAARFDLRIDPGRFIPGRVVKLLNERVMRESVEDLRRHFAAGVRA